MKKHVVVICLALLTAATSAQAAVYDLYVIDLAHIGHGPDPWGGYRRGIAGSTVLTLKDFGITKYLAPASRQVEMFLSIEGIRRK